ncbi:Tlg2-vesicle protein [Mortierella claussenii]|nr:Tlg2-vesicle protein [Mortierella claussenii]
MATRARLPTIQERLRSTSTKQRIVITLAVLIVLAFIVVFFTFDRQIFEWLEPAVTYIRGSSGGLWVMASIMAATCIFPLFGYGVVSMICGYVYGLPKGFLPAFIGDVLGASACFWLYRLAFREYITRKFGDNIEFREMSKAVSKDGIFVLFLIRLSSFPFAVLNAYFGAMTQLPYWKFIVATALSTPRLFLPIFIGHNILSLSDPNITGKDRILKWVGNISGIVIALAVGWYIYRHTTRRISRINAGLAAEEGEENDELEERYRQQRLAEQQRYGDEEDGQERGLSQNSSPSISSSPTGSCSKHRRLSTYDNAVSMDELQSLQAPVSSHSQSAETITVVVDTPSKGVELAGKEKKQVDSRGSS